jgi:hypothetical protein
LIGGHIEPVVELSATFFFFVQSLVLLGIELLANTVRNVIVGLENSTLLHVFDEGLQMVCLQSIVPFSLRIFPAILSFVATWRPGTSHDTIHITPDGMLAGDLLGVNPSVSVSEHPCGH